MRLQKRVGERGDSVVKIMDVEEIFKDEDPSDSFINHVKGTLEMNIEDPFGRYLMLYMAISNGRQFTYLQAKECAQLLPSISEDRLKSNLEILTVTSVLRQLPAHVYEFSVPDYPSILSRLGGTDNIELLEKEIRQ